MTTNLTHPNIQEFCKTRKCLTALLDKQNIKPKKFKTYFFYLLLDCTTTNFGPLLTIQFQPKCHRESHNNTRLGSEAQPST